MSKPMSVETKIKMLNVIQSAFESRIDLTAQLLGSTRKDILAIKRSQETLLPTDEDILFIFIQAKWFRKMNYKKPFSMLTRPIFSEERVVDLLMERKEIPTIILQYLKTIDTMEAETRARGQSRITCHPFRSIRDAIEDISTPIYAN